MLKRCLIVLLLFFAILSRAQTARIAVSNTVRMEGTTIQICGAVTLSFADSSVGSNNTRTWIFKNGNPLTSTSINASVAFNTQGIDTVFLISNGAIPDTTFILVQVNPKPTASFTFTNNVCAGSNVTFTNTSTGVGSLTYNWTFGTGVGAPPSSSLTNPTVVFNPSVGSGSVSYVVNLYVNSSNGCTKDTNQSVSVKLLPGVDFSDSNVFAAPSFTNCLAGPSALNPTFRLVINNNITNQSHISTYQINWGIGNLVNYPTPLNKAVNIYNVLGKFNLSITANGVNGCVSNKEYLVANQSNPAVGITSNGNTQGCAPMLLPFILGGYTNNSPGTYYVFDPDDGSPTIRLDTITNDTIWHLFTKTSCGRSGNQFVPKITAFNVCDSTTASVTNVKIWIKPRAKFFISDTVICFGQSILVRDSTIKGAHGNSCTNTTIYNWTFQGANPSASSTQGPHTLTYSAPGLYKIVLTVSNPCGVDSMVKWVCVQPPPQPSFNFTWNTSSRCAPAILTLNNTSNTLTSCGNTNYAWAVTPSGGTSFVDTTTSSSTHPHIQFLNGGTYNVKLTITNKCGTVFKDTSIVVKGLPQVQLPPDKNYCDTTTIAFNASNSFHTPTYNANGGTITSYLWSISSAGATFVGTTNANSQYPIIRFTQPGTYKIKVEVTNECGTNADSQMVNIWSPVGVPTVRDTFSCGSGSFSLSGLVGTNGTTLRWYNDSLTSAILATSLTYATSNLTNSRSYFVSSFNAATGCESGRVKLNVLIRSIPNTPSGIKVTRCGASSVILNVTPGLNGNKVKWYTAASGGVPIYMGNPFTTPILTNTTIYYASTFDSIYGCESVTRFADTVVINPLPNVFAGNDTSFCNLPGNVNVIGLPSGGAWSGPGVTTSGLFSPTMNGIGIYNLVYSFTNSITGCLNRDTIAVSVVGATLPNAGADTSVCKSNNPFTLQGIPSGGNWSGSNVTATGIFTPSIVGSFSLIYSTGSGSCLARDTVLVTVRPLPIPNFTLANGVCPNQQVSLAATNGNGVIISGYNWFVTNTKTFSTAIISDTISSTTTITFPENQTTDTALYRIKLRLISIDGCADSITKGVVLNKRPNVQFALSGNSCGPTTLIVNNTTSNSPNSWIWSSSPSSGVVFSPSTTVSNPSILLPVNNTVSTIAYKFYLTATLNGIGANCSDVDSSVFSIFPKPFVSFSNSVDSGCTPLVLSFDNKSDPKNNQVQSLMGFLWRLNNQLISSDTVPSDLLLVNNSQRDSILTVKLIGTTSNGCVDSLTKSITVFPNSKASFSFTASSSCAPFNLGASNIVLNPFPLANSTYLWQVLNPVSGLVLTSVNGVTPPSFTINNPNDSVVFRLIANNSRGCKPDTFQQVFRTISNPVANFISSDSVGCSSLSVQFTNTSSVGVSNLWTLSTGYSSSSRDINRVFTNNSSTNDQTIQVKLVITAGGSGCKDSITKFVRVLPKPLSIISLPSTQLCANQNYQLSSNSQTKNPSTYNWSISGSQTATLGGISGNTTVLNLPDNKGNSDSITWIGLRTVSADGCFHDTTVQLTWLRRPDAKFNLPLTSCGPQNIIPTNQTNNIPTSQLTWNWSIAPTSGSVNNSNLFQPFIFLPENNTSDSINYRVKLVATSTNGCKDSAERVTTIYPRPLANFDLSPSAGCTPLTVAFDNKSIARNNEPITSLLFQWSVNGQFVSADTVLNDLVLNNTSTKDSSVFITQVVTSKHGCRDTITKVTTLYPNPRAVFNASLYTSCAPFVVTPANLALTQFPNANTTYTWQVLSGNGLLVRKSQNGLIPPSDTIVNPSDSIRYRLIATNANGCKADTMESIFRTIANPLAAFVVSDSVGCSGGVYNFNNQSSSGVSLNWHFSNGVQSVITNPSVQFLSSSNLLDTLHWAKLIITAGGTGCKDSTIKFIRILPKPRSIINAVNPQFCSGQTVSLNEGSLVKLPATFKWSKVGVTVVNLTDTNTPSVKIALPNNQGASDSSFSISLRTTSVDGCVSDTTVSLLSLRRPLSNFTIPPSVCHVGSFSPVNFTSNINTSQLTWNWSTSPTTALVGLPTAKEPNIALPINSSNDSIVYAIRLITERQTYGCKDTSTRFITVYPKPIVLYTATTDTACTPMVVNFDNKSNARNGDSQTTLAHKWYINDVLISQDSVLAEQIFINNSTKDSVIAIKLVSTSKHGCVDSLTKYFVIYPNAKAHYVSSRIFSCAPFTIDSFVVKTKLYPGANLNYAWYVNSNFVSNSTFFPGYTISKADDSVLVKLIVLSLHGCQADSLTTNFKTIPNPVPNFNASDSVGCMPLATLMNNTSTPVNGLSYLWKVGNDTSTAKNPAFSLYNYGVTDTLILARLVIIAGNTGCKDSIDKYIRVKPLPKPSFVFGASVNCFPVPIQLTNNTPNTPIIKTGSYKWRVYGFGLSISNDTTSASTQIGYPDNQTGAPRNVTVSLTALSDFGCVDSVIKTVSIPTRPIANFSFNRLLTCVYDTIGITDASSFATNYLWSSNQLGVTLYSPTSANTIMKGVNTSTSVDSVYFIKLKVFNNLGCSDSVVKQINVSPKPKSNLIIDKSAGCSPLLVHFKQSSFSKLGSNYYWRFESNLTGVGDSLQHTFLGSDIADTTYAVRLVTTTVDNCSDTTETFITAKAGAKAMLLVPDSVFCMNQNVGTVFITNKSYGSVDTFLFDFGDSTKLLTKSDSSVTHKYFTEGTYRIKLTASNICRTSTDSVQFKVLNKPMPQFSLTDTLGCSPLRVYMSNNTNSYQSNYLWNFGNGTLSNLKQPDTVVFYQSKLFDTTYFVKLSAFNFCGISSVQDTVRVLPIPVANFIMSTDSGCSPLPVSFLNTTTGLPSMVKWSFGNGDTSRRYNPYPVVYRTEDTTAIYKVKLLASNQCGADSITKSIKVEPNSVRAFFTTSGNTGCAPFKVSFNNQSIGGSYVAWDFGNGQTSTINQPVVTYQTSGVFTVYLFVNNGCSYDTAKVVINVLKIPQFAITKTSSVACMKQPITFKSQLQDSGSIVWYLSPSDSFEQREVTFAYATEGLKPILVKLKSATNFCSNFLVDTVKINPIPIVKANVEIDNQCLYKEFNFSNNGSTVLNTFYKWVLSDGNSYTTNSIKHIFNNSGSYQVKLIASTTLGCSDSAELTVNAFPKPNAKFDYTPKDTCAGPVLVKFNNQSQGAVGYKWDFGNTFTSQQTNPSTTYSGVGAYPVVLVVNNEYNCFDTAKANYNIYNIPVSNFTFSSNNGCEPLNIQFQNTSIHGSKWVWDFGDGFKSTLQNPTHTYHKSGTYDVRLTVTEGGMCSDSLTLSKVIKVEPKPVANFTAYLDSTVRPYSVIILTNQSFGAVKYLWMFDDNTISTEENPRHKFAIWGDHNVKLIVYTDKNCSDTIEMHVYVPEYKKGLYVPNAFTPDYGQPEVRVFKPVGVELKSYHIQVLNKWGELMWESDKLDEQGRPLESWDGRDKNGVPCSQGAYVWIIKAQHTDGVDWEGMVYPTGSSKPVTSGNVTLIR